MAYMPVGDPIHEQYHVEFQFLALTIGIGAERVTRKDSDHNIPNLEHAKRQIIYWTVSSIV